MDRIGRKHVERAQRVADFARQYPSDLPGYQAALDRIDERLARATEVAQEEVANRRAEQAVIAEQLELRGQITAELQFVAGIARTAGRESVGTPIVLRYPGPQRNQLQFLTGARQVVAKAATEEEQLRRFGLSADQLTTLSAELDGFARLLSLREGASRTHIGARRQLHALTADLKVVV